jgi:hypothetical protein
MASGRVQGVGMSLVCLVTSPNKGIEPTPYSLRSASASGRGSCPALVRQAKLGVSCGVEVPTG